MNYSEEILRVWEYCTLLYITHFTYVEPYERYYQGISFLFKVNCSDLTFGFRIFPTKIIQSINWEMLNHSFLFETIIKPIKLGTKVIEINSHWKKRIEVERRR